MCGRYSFASDVEVLTKIFKLKSAPSMAPRYNISPSQKCAVILKIKNGERYMSSMRWGLVPRWSKGPNNQFSMFNARSETADTKPAFRDSFKNRHCLIPADGYYEWKTNATGKQALEIMTTKNFTGLPVTEENSELLGIITMRDLRYEKNLHYKDLYLLNDPT